MVTPPAIDARSPAGRSRIWAGIGLLALGLLGHLYAAHAIGGTRLAYGHHVFGFFLILAVTGAIVAALGRHFWRSRPDVTVLVIGAVQALVGLLVALAPHRAAGAG
jgi:hypothetical protein